MLSTSLSLLLAMVLLILAGSQALDHVEREMMQEQHFLAAGVRERQKRAGLGLLERLNKEVPETCEEELCPRGLELHKSCNDTVDKKTLCVPCRYKYYKEEKSNEPCRPCSVCAPGQKEAAWCTTKRNTLCSGDYVAPKPQVIESKPAKKKEKSLVPSYMITVVFPCAVLVACFVTALCIYIRIKTSKQKMPDKSPLTQNEEVDCCYDDAGPLPSKVAILDPKSLPSSINYDSAVPSGSRVVDGQEPNVREYRMKVDTIEWTKATGWRKFCSTPNIPDTCDSLTGSQEAGKQE